jgi:hypothetical protein
MRYVTLSISVLLFLFLWEHVAYVNEITFRPTLPLVKLVCVFETLFYYIGILFGRIGSLITYLHLDKLCDTLAHICYVIKDLIMTIRYVKEGIMYVSELFDNVKQVYSTSMFLLFLVGITTGGLFFVMFDKINNNKISRGESVYDFFRRCKSKIESKEKTN